MVSSKMHQAMASQVARILRVERQKLGLSLSTLGERAGLSYQMISYVEREMRSPTLDTLLRITGALHVSLAEVMRRAEKASGPGAK
jgi:transcriptional regulator with XRE-family HTH domain